VANSDGKVIGILCAGFKPSSPDILGIFGVFAPKKGSPFACEFSFAIPSKKVLSSARRIIAGKKIYPRPKIGIVVRKLNKIIREHLNIPKDCGLKINIVLKGSPAQKAGLKPRDIILKINNKLANYKVLKQIVKAMSRKECKKLVFEILRKGKIKIFAGGQKMKAAVLAVFPAVVCMLITTGAFLQDEQDIEQRIKKLIEDLGHEDYFKREAAHEELKKIGKPALKYLEEAQNDKDAERAARAKRIIEHIRKQEREKKRIERRRKKQGGMVFSCKISSFTPDGKYELEIRPTGEVILIVEEKGKKPKTYKAESIEEFKKKYPEIAKKYGIQRLEKGFRFRIETIPRRDRFRIPLPEEWEDEFEFPKFEDLEKELEKLKQRLRKYFQELEEWRRGFRIPEPPEPPEEPFEPGFPLPQVPKKKPSVKTKPLFGIKIKPVDETLREHLGLEKDEGVVVEWVKEGSVAQRVGIKPNDIITKINGKTVLSTIQLRKLVTEAVKKEKIEVEIVRKGKRMTLTSELKKIKKEY
jgi:S1-C subfamily serine protease